MTKKNKTILISTISLILVIGLVIFLVADKQDEATLENNPTDQSVATVGTSADSEQAKPVEVVPEGPKKGQQYYTHLMKTTQAEKEIATLVGPDNLMAVLQTNRIDANNIKQGSTVIIPVAFDMESRSPFPLTVDALTEVSKIIMFSQRVQAFAAYENGTLVRWGSISSGKKSTKTPNGLFSTNWKGKEVKSSFDDEWVLKYNFNILNFEGIGFHQYSMPGYPASHSCVRMLMDDAMWLYDWADQWVLDGGGQERIAHGTAVILFGDYGFGKTAPWKLLPEDAAATDISIDEINQEVSKNIDTILARQAQRETVLATE